MRVVRVLFDSFGFLWIEYSNGSISQVRGKRKSGYSPSTSPHNGMSLWGCSYLTREEAELALHSYRFSRNRNGLEEERQPFHKLLEGALIERIEEPNFSFCDLSGRWRDSIWDRRTQKKIKDLGYKKGDILPNWAILYRPWSGK